MESHPNAQKKEESVDEIKLNDKPDEPKLTNIGVEYSLKLRVLSKTLYIYRLFIYILIYF